MTTMIITRQQLRAWRACYSDERLAELVPLKGLTLVQVLEREDVPWRDRLWVLAQARPAVARRLAVWAAGLALRHWTARYPEDRRVRDALRVASASLRGQATEEQARAAAAAAAARAARVVRPAETADGEEPVGWPSRESAMLACDDRLISEGIVFVEGHP